MASETEDFRHAGPLHLTSIDWKCAHHRRSVAACLVQGVYILERDRQAKRLGTHALAPRWWEFFHFQLVHKLVDVDDSSIFGAIYEFKASASCYNYSLDQSPRYVIAFRGNLIKADSVLRDLELDLRFILNDLHMTPRFEIAMQAVRNMVDAVGDSNVWLAGHSLGSAMAMLAGKTMAKSGIFLQSFLFNPPFPPTPLETIKCEKVKHGVRFAKSAIKGWLILASNVVEDSFVTFSAWFPCLFVNPGDPICSGYIGYFEHRKKMVNIGAGVIERMATQKSTIGLLMNAQGKESEPSHLIPSASLTINLTHSPNRKQAHGLLQWWKPDLQLQSNLYDYRELLSL